MSFEGKRSISDLDKGLRALKKFINRSGIGNQSENRKLITDAPYQFDITTTSLRRHDQRQPDTTVHVVKIPEGSTLYFPERTAASAGKPSTVDAADFIVNDGTSSWRINTVRWTVQWREYNFGGKVVHLKPGTKTHESRL